MAVYLSESINVTINLVWGYTSYLFHCPVLIICILRLFVLQINERGVTATRLKCKYTTKKITKKGTEQCQGSIAIHNVWHCKLSTILLC